MSRLVAALRATVVAVFVFLYLFVIGLPLILHAWLRRDIGWLYAGACLCARLALWLGGVRVEVNGAENLPAGGTCIYMANHQSYIDPAALLVALPPRLAAMAKQQVFSWPIFGAVIRLGNCVPVDREHHEAARASVDEAVEKVQGGQRFLVFPEGTRTPDGRLLPFKHGVFVLALKTGAPIVPITLEGGQALMPKRRWALYRGVERVTIHPPVETAAWTLDQRAALADKVREIIGSALPLELRGTAAIPAQPSETPAR